MECENLVIAPHADDEVLGCGGILDENSFVYICGVDESMLNTGETKLDQRLSELLDVAKFLKFRLEYSKTSKVNYYDEHELIGIFEELINRIKPKKVFIPCPDYNQDHRAVYNAAFIALRPHDKNFFVKKVLVYETSHSAVWNPVNVRLNYIVPIDIEKKIAAYQLYKSEVRSMRSPEMFRSIARIRGRAINAEYAEAFEILRWVD